MMLFSHVWGNYRILCDRITKNLSDWPKPRSFKHLGYESYLGTRCKQQWYALSKVTNRLFFLGRLGAHNSSSKPVIYDKCISVNR